MTPQTAIDTQARQLKYQVGLMVIGLILAELGLSAWLSAWLSGPIRALAKTAEAVTLGDLESLPPITGSAPREIAKLTVAVRSMITSLRVHTQDLESQVAARTRELSQANSELTSALHTIRKNDRLVRADIAQARVFQEKMLPAPLWPEEFDIGTVYLPLAQVSGDIYDLTALAPNHLRLFIADATGHGVQAAMRTILLKSAYDRIKSLQDSPSSALAAMNDYLVQEFPEGDLHCTASCVDILLTKDDAEIIYSNAGAPPLFVFSPGSTVQEIYAEGSLLGADSVSWPEPTRFRLRPNQLLLVASDGLTEQWNPERVRYDSQIIGLQLQEGESCSRLVERLVQHFHAFRGAQGVADDVTAIAIRWRHNDPIAREKSIA